ncbi:hypothetical protein [Natronococcus occultus]|uniref:Uncharacterized protein n=1 Tax=Natronococcus occultus SP4 TaxID=694430 RepID=L0K398_9EURY|nr:hypothetical protein [Natronococcus occultus]AGB38588.1 hypothetical protein Natoc_2829 [Natronococcus occultus SP4]
MSEDDADEESFEELLSAGESSLENLQTALEDVDTPEELGDGELEELLGDVDTLVRVAQETGELVESLDLSELPEAVDGDELLEAIETGEIPDAVGEDETGVTDVVDLTQLFSALDLLRMWDASDLTEIWEQKRELDEATDALGDGEDDGTLEDAAETVVDEGTDLIGDEDDDGLLDDVEPREAAMEALEKPDVEEDPEAYQVFIQQQAIRGIDAFRDALLETHETFQELYETNREKMRREDTSTSSRNPTAASTIATERRDIGTSDTRHSTVPKQVKLSTAPTRRRIYGRRFELELERKRRQQNND